MTCACQRVNAILSLPRTNLGTSWCEQLLRNLAGWLAMALCGLDDTA